jgi:hypothetical protein
MFIGTPWAEVFIEIHQELPAGPWYEHRRYGSEHEWWLGNLQMQWSPRGWRKHRPPDGGWRSARQ